MSALSFSMNGIRYATAFFITRALLITCNQTLEHSMCKVVECLHTYIQTTRKTPPHRKTQTRHTHPSHPTHLGQKHLASAEKVTDDIHALHQRTLDDTQGPGIEFSVLACFLRVFLHVLVDALRVCVALAPRQPANIYRVGTRTHLDQGVRQPVLHTPRTPLLRHRHLLRPRAQRLRILQHTLSRIRSVRATHVLSIKLTPGCWPSMRV